MLKIKKTYKVGDRFRDTKNNEEYILACVGYNPDNHLSSMILICLKDGCRWTDAILVKKQYSVSFEDIEKLTGYGIFEEVIDDKSK